jgi:hypothetical protein
MTPVEEEREAEGQQAEPAPLRCGEIVTYVSDTAFGPAVLPAVIMSIHPDHIGLRIFADRSGGSEWPVNAKWSDKPQVGCFMRKVPTLDA